MENNSKNTSSRLTWLVGGLAAIAIFALCFLAIDYVSQPEKEKEPEVEMAVIATTQTNAPLIDIARSQGWIAPDATEITTIDASKVKELGTAFQNSRIESFRELRHFVGLQEIKAGAFAHAEALTAIVIPANVITIEDGALAYCPSLTEISVDDANTHYDSRGNCNAIVCTWKGDLMLVAGCRTTTIPDDVRYIAPQAFCGCAGLAAIDLPERLDEIGNEAFRDAVGLQKIEIPKGVRFVKPGTFRGCTALKEVTLSKSVERLQKEAFAGCTSLAVIRCPKKYPPIVEHAFDSYSATIYVPAGMQNKYFIDKTWKNFKTYKEL